MADKLRHRRQGGSCVGERGKTVPAASKKIMRALTVGLAVATVIGLAVLLVID
jgi:hypothetical protein